jgi:hypothetical protein
MNRIAKYLNNEEKPDEEQPVARDYWVVRCYGMAFHVRPPQALRIKRALERRWKRRGWSSATSRDPASGCEPHT